MDFNGTFIILVHVRRREYSILYYTIHLLTINKSSYKPTKSNNYIYVHKYREIGYNDNLWFRNKSGRNFTMGKGFQYKSIYRYPCILILNRIFLQSESTHYFIYEYTHYFTLQLTFAIYMYKPNLHQVNFLKSFPSFQVSNDKLLSTILPANAQFCLVYVKHPQHVYTS